MLLMWSRSASVVQFVLPIFNRVLISLHFPPCLSTNLSSFNCIGLLADLIFSRESEVLKARVKELEDQFRSQQHFLPTRQPPLPSPAASDTATTSTDNGSVMDRQAPQKTFWQGIRTQSALSKETQYYGPASSFYFTGRMSSYLTQALSRPLPDRLMQPNSASQKYVSLTVTKNGELGGSSLDDANLGDNLTEIQEDYFLGLFWQSYNCTYQIIIEDDFKKYHQSLWEPRGSPRKPSALVDIVLALSVQLGAGTRNAQKRKADPKPSSDLDTNDATIAGRSLYRRCQALLISELESPSISTLQCQLLSLVYLCNASYQNTAHSMSALAVRTAHILGLHLEPPADLPRPEREFRKRLWWTLYAVETKTSMKLGRPSAVHRSQSNCTLPADDHELARSSGSIFVTVSNDVTWLTYNLQCTKLILTACRIYKAFWKECASILRTLNGGSLYDDPEAFERAAEFLEARMPRLKDWRAELPQALKTKRRRDGKPFSRDHTPLDIEPFAPLWLQRQRLILELLYHNLSMNLCRPFIRFPTSYNDYEVNTHFLATSSARSAVVITEIMHQTLTETSILDGWHEAFQWQWNAAITMCGYHFCDPEDRFPFTEWSRDALEKAIEVFKIMGKSFAISASAADVVRNLIEKAVLLERHPSDTESENSDSQNRTDPAHIFDPNKLPTDGFGFGEGLLGGTMGLSFTVDATTDFEALWAGSMFDTWVPNMK